MEVSTRYLSARTRKLLARMRLYCGERLGLVAMMVASRQAKKASNNVRGAAYTTMQNRW